MQGQYRMRDTILLSLACLGGAILAAPLPLIGLPMIAAAFAGLVYMERMIAAVVISVLSSAVVGLILTTTELLAIIPAITAILIAIVALRRHDPYAVIVCLAPVLAVSFVARDLVIPWLAGQVYTELARETLAAAAEAFVAAIPVVLAILWAARRAGVKLKGSPGIANLDFSPHMLWPLVLALALGASGRILNIGDGMLTDLGFGLLLATKVILFLQGFAVVAFFLKPMNIGRRGLFFVGVMAFIIDGPTWIVSIAGLLDFWLNFRKLNREDASGSQSSEALNNSL